ncbi:hypothetical protein HYT02_04290 [Candidatus Gottesmanbacteria bacterium]|nr:hypothetical protein [Candidatus Gottesmanbacteria bacterium]
MIKKLSLFVLFFFLIVSVISLKSQKAVGQSSSLIGDVTLYQFFQNGNPLEGMLVSIPLNQTIDDPLNFTIYLDINGDKKFHQNEIVVEEFPAFAEEEFPNAFPILAKSKHSIALLTNLPKGSILDAKIILTNQTNEKGVIEREAMKTIEDIGEIFDPAPGFVGGTVNNIFIPPIIDIVYAQGGKKDPSKVPVNHKGIPDLGGRSGKPNECVPLSFANSLLWLAKTHGFGSKMPANDNALIDELVTDMKWTKDGVKHENILPGKEAITTRRGLPLTNKKIDNEVIEGESQLWKKIVAELNDGEDVELIIDFKQSPKGNATKSHAVTVTGADKTKKGKQTVTFHDPATPKGSETYEMDRNGQIVGYPLGKVYGNFIISESFNGPTSTPSPTPSPTITPSQSTSPT